MKICTTVEELREARAGLVGPVALVPTMGALHAGHLSHVEALRRHAELTGEKLPGVVVSLFVNPTQFGPSEDLARYPKTLEMDAAACAAAGVELLFVPSVEAMYPPGVPAVEINVPAVASGLEGVLRPTHFAGVCRVVLKLLHLVWPDAVTFGRKDYQQLCVVRAMIEDLMLAVEVVEVQTMRDDDGLAMSSRNRYLDGSSRQHGLGLSKALRQAEQMAAAGETDPAAIEAMMGEVMAAHHIAVDYAAVRRTRTLAEVDTVEPGHVVALVAGRVGEDPGVRLIDNRRLGQA